VVNTSAFVEIRARLQEMKGEKPALQTRQDSQKGNKPVLRRREPEGSVPVDEGGPKLQPR
jgi:hypothetical protein